MNDKIYCMIAVLTSIGLIVAIYGTWHKLFAVTAVGWIITGVGALFMWLGDRRRSDERT